MDNPLDNAHLPVILPPSSGIDPIAYYEGLSLVITASSLGQNGVHYIISGSSTALSFFAMFDGWVTFVPPGNNFPNTSIPSDPGGNGAIFLQILPLVMKYLPGFQNFSDMPPNSTPPYEPLAPDGLIIPTHIIYDNADPIAFRSKMEELIVFVPMPVIDESWRLTEGTDPEPIDPAIKKVKYIDNVMVGQRYIGVKGGYEIGETVVGPGGGIEFTLRLLVDEIGNNFFETSPLLFVRRFPDFIDKDGIPMPKWTGHPLITSSDSLSIEIDIFVKFEIWNPDSVPNPSSPDFVPVDAGVEIKLLDFDYGPWFDEVKSLNTDENGTVHFSLPQPGEQDILNYGFPDFYFKIINPVASASTIDPSDLPPEWSTKGSGETFWMATNGLGKGYYKSFQGGIIGTPTNPLTFRIGVDYHYKLEMFQLNSMANNFIPKGTMFVADNTSIRIDNDNGLVHGISFGLGMVPEFPDYQPFKVVADIEESLINLYASVDPYSGPGSGPTTWILPEKLNGKTSFGSTSNPLSRLTSSAASDKIRASFYILKIAKEVFSFLVYFTNGSFNSSQQLTINYRLGHLIPGAAATSWPFGVIFLTEDTAAWDRSTIIHETFHQVMWLEAKYHNKQIVDQFILDGITSGDFTHFDKQYSTKPRALMEGWSLGFESLMNFRRSTVFRLDTVTGGPVTTITPTNANELNAGEYCESAFANFLFNAFWHHVVEPVIGSSLPPTKNIKESIDGDILKNNIWLNTSNRSALAAIFIRIIRQPLIKMDGYFFPAGYPEDFPDSNDFLTEVLFSANEDETARLLGEMVRWNMNVSVPVINSLNTTSGPASGGTIVKIFGDHFVHPTISRASEISKATAFLYISFGGVLATGLTVLNINKIECVAPPGTAGTTVGVKVELEIRGFSVYSNAKPFSYL